MDKVFYFKEVENVFLREQSKSLTKEYILRLIKSTYIIHQLYISSSLTSCSFHMTTTLISLSFNITFLDILLETIEVLAELFMFKEICKEDVECPVLLTKSFVFLNFTK